ncbi:MAG: ribosome biogenesis GTPase YlqF [Candidatus Desulforudis sp.]|nr:ribosome biogenesis GTPase YlqF [Desulforudis sp.]
MSVSWYPGHMVKAKRLIREQLRVCDLVFELADARIPESSRNPVLGELTAHKPRILVLTKPDLADPTLTRRWMDLLRDGPIPVLKFNAARGGRTKNVFDAALAVLNAAGDRPQAFRAVTVGIPNVGKSSFINRLTGQRVTQTGRRPGVTRGKQWIRINRWLELLDTPGTLWPRTCEAEVGYKLAVTGAIPDEAVDKREVAGWLISWIKQHNPRALIRRYELRAVPGEIGDLLEIIGLKRGLLLPGGKVDHEKTAAILIKDFRNGLLGRFTLDSPEKCE